VLARPAPLELKRQWDGRIGPTSDTLLPPQIGRQVILATATEAFITIPDIGFVHDNGCTNIPIYYPTQSTLELVTVHVSRSQAAQRAGRARRVGLADIFGVVQTDESHKLLETGATSVHLEDLSPLFFGNFLMWE